MLAAGAWSWTQRQYYVGEYDGQVTIYRGVNADLPGLELSQPYETSDIALTGPERRTTRTRSRDGIGARRPRRRPAYRRQPGRRGGSSPATSPAAADAATPPVPTPRRGGPDMSQTGTIMGFVHRRRRGRRAVPARPRARRRHRRLRRGRPRRRGHRPGRHHRLRRLARRARRRRPRHRPVHRAVRRPGAAAGRRRAQRARPGRDPPARPGLPPRPTPASPREQLIWMTLGVVLFVADPAACCATTGVLQRFTYTLGLVAIVLLLLPLVPGLGGTINGARIWIRLGRLQLPARRGRQGAAGHRLRRLPRAPPRRAGPGRAPGAVRRPAPRPRPRPDPRDVAGQPRHPGLPARPRLEPAVLRPVPGRCSTSPPSGRAGWWSAARCSSAARCVGYRLFGHVSDRVDIWLDPFGHYGRHRRPASSRSRRCSGWAGAG